MFRSKLIIPALSVVCLLGSQAVVPSMAQAESPLRMIVAAQPVAGARMVHLNLANSSSVALELKVGETPVTVAPGETIKISAPAGTKITVATASGKRNAGDLLAEVSKDLSGATIRLN